MRNRGENDDETRIFIIDWQRQHRCSISSFLCRPWVELQEWKKGERGRAVKNNSRLKWWESEDSCAEIQDKADENPFLITFWSFFVDRSHPSCVTLNRILLIRSMCRQNDNFISFFGCQQPLYDFAESCVVNFEQKQGSKNLKIDRKIATHTKAIWKKRKGWNALEFNDEFKIVFIKCVKMSVEMFA